MIPLPQKKRYHEFDYTQILRTGFEAIYEQRVAPNCFYYEVFSIKKLSDKIIGGKLAPAHEKWPKDEDFGKTAWSIKELDKAILRLIELIKNRKRNEHKNS